MAGIAVPYENQLIGAFLVGVGYHGGRENFPHPVRVNLHQQGPLDTVFGDLLVGAECFVAIEFKRLASREDMRKETAKWDVVALKQWLDASPVRWKLARRAHLLAFGNPGVPGAICWLPYMDAIVGKQPGAANAPEVMQTSDLLIRELYEPTVLGAAPDEVLDYLNAIWKFRKAADADTGGGRSYAKEPAFLGVAVDSNKTIRFVAEDCLSMVLEYQLRPEHVSEKKVEKQHTRERSGPSL